MTAGNAVGGLLIPVIKCNISYKKEKRISVQDKRITIPSNGSNLLTKGIGLKNIVIVVLKKVEKCFMIYSCMPDLFPLYEIVLYKMI